MTSQINITNIDTTYPIAGQDNDSQGFRDNFTAITSALGVAKDEITALQNSTAKINTTTNFDNNIIQNVRLQNSSFVSLNSNPIVSNISINYAQGSYQTYNISTNTTFTVSTSSSWPSSGNYGHLKLSVIPTSTAAMTVNFDPGLGKVKKEASFALPYTATSTATIMFDVWTVNAGNDVYVKFLGTFTNA